MLATCHVELLLTLTARLESMMTTDRRGFSELLTREQPPEHSLILSGGLCVQAAQYEVIAFLTSDNAAWVSDTRLAHILIPLEEHRVRHEQPPTEPQNVWRNLLISVGSDVS